MQISIFHLLALSLLHPSQMPTFEWSVLLIEDLERGFAEWRLLSFKITSSLFNSSLTLQLKEVSQLKAI